MEFFFKKGQLKEAASTVNRPACKTASKLGTLDISEVSKGVSRGWEGLQLIGGAGSLTLWFSMTVDQEGVLGGG